MRTVRRKVEFIYHPDGLPVPPLFLHGSWNKEGAYQLEWSGDGTPMEAQPDGSYRAEVTLRTASRQLFSWGVKDAQGCWMLFEHQAPTFLPGKSARQVFRLGHRHMLGLHHINPDGFRAGVWAPRAVSVELVVGISGREQSIEMVPEGEYWFAQGKRGWKAWEGLPYGFRILTASGQRVLRADPYARVRQGPQRGVGDLFLSKEGRYCHRYNLPSDGVHLLRFEACPRSETPLRHPPRLSFYRDGVRLKKSQLRLLTGLRPALPRHQPWWEDHALPDGSILLPKHHGAKAYSVCIGPERTLRGLEYKLVGEEETYHDPWSTLLDGHHNWPRLGLVLEPGRANRTLCPAQRAPELRMYEVHIGSILGSAENLHTSHLGDLESALPEIKRMGFNTVALMPTNATEGWRDWGYLGTGTFAHQESYAAPQSHAEESLIRFINRAHRLHLRVFNDVVYNHIGGFHNDLWEFDGLENSWFERETVAEVAEGELPERPYDTVECLSRTVTSTVRKTPWGPIPAFNKSAVSQFYIDHAVDQIERLGFDGLRFDFTNLIHNRGAGDSEGWRMLQAIHLRLRYFFPNAVTFAEEFPPHPIVTTSVEQGGAGFDGMWNTEHQHRLIFDHHRPSITQNLVEDSHPNLSYLLEHLLFPHGFSDGCSSATVLSNHDEVGNAQRLYNLVRRHPRGLDIARLVCWFSLLCPGHPILFQGTEDLASNFFSWGLPHTWDLHSHLSGHHLPKYRQLHQRAVKDILNLRRTHPDLHAHSVISRHYLHQARLFLVLNRGRFWIAANFGQTPQEVPAPLPEHLELMASSEKKSYGYLGRATRGRRVGGYALKVWVERSP